MLTAAECAGDNEPTLARDLGVPVGAAGQPEKPQEGTVGRAVAWVLPSPPSHTASGKSLSLCLGPLPCTTRCERLAGPCVGQAEATSVKSGGVR